MNEIEQLQQALNDWALEWDEVWRVALDRRERTVTVITADGRKLSAPLPVAAKRVKLVK